MATSSKRKSGRPRTWPDQIDAPKGAIAFYKLIADLPMSEDFNVCHVFGGAILRGVPVIKWEGVATPMAKVFGSFLGLKTGNKLCATYGCCNPLHYSVIRVEEVDESRPFVGDTGVGPLTERVVAPPVVGLEDYIDTIKYYIDENNIKEAHYIFSVLRPLIHPDDMSDEILKAALQQMQMDMGAVK